MSKLIFIEQLVTIVSNYVVKFPKHLSFFAFN